MSGGVTSEQSEISAQNLLQMKQDFSLDDWRKGIRARVTALKCHVMATRGLTPNGENVQPYSPEILFRAENNAQYLNYATKKELEEYVTKAMVELCKGTEIAEETKSSLGVNDVELALEIDQSFHTTPVSLPSPSLSLSFLSKPMAFASPDDQISDNSQAESAELPQSPNSREDISNNHNTIDEVDTIRAQLHLKTIEVEKLTKIREEVEGELQELTANLFQEAHNMVQEANQRAAGSDKSLKECNMQVEVLQAEVSALKTLVITSTPSSPNPHLHPQIIAKGAQAVMAEAGKLFYRGHKKSPSDFDLKYGRDTTPPSSPLKDCGLYDAVASSTGFALDPDCWEVDPVVHKEFVEWRQEPLLTRDAPFMSRIYTEDIDFCLAFPNSMLAHKVQRAIEDNALYIEEVNPRQKNSCPKKCVLLDVPRYCKYRFRLGDADSMWYYISQLARNRIIAVCDFLSYLRYIQLGLVKSSIHDVYWEVVKLRKQMSQARLGL